MYQARGSAPGEGWGGGGGGGGGGGRHPCEKDSKPPFDFPWGVGGWGRWGGGSEGWVEGSRGGRVEGERSFEAGIRGLKSTGDTLKLQFS